MADKPQTETETGKALVVYFSCTGNTKRAAQYASDILGAELYEITPEVPYTSDDLNYHDERTRATVEQKDSSARPAIVGDVANFNQYSTVVLAFPIWWGQEPRILDTFMESHDFGGKTVVPMCTSNSSDMGSSAVYLEELTKGSAKWLKGKRFDWTPMYSGKGRLSFENGDITYCAKNNTLAIFYDQTDHPDLTMEVIRVGRIKAEDLVAMHRFGNREEITFVIP